MFFRLRGDVAPGARVVRRDVRAERGVEKNARSLGFDNVLVAGDTRFDRVAEIARAAKRVDIVERFKGDNRLFVAGSTWGPTRSCSSA